MTLQIHTWLGHELTLPWRALEDFWDNAHCVCCLSGQLCDFIMSHEAHAAIPVLFPVVETWGALSVVFRMSLVADLVAHTAVIGQPYQGLCVYIRSWLSVHSPLLLSSFPACVQLWAPLPRCEPACQVHSCWPALPASCSCPSTREPEQEESCRLLVLLVPYFSRHMLLCAELLLALGLKQKANTFQC